MRCQYCNIYLQHCEIQYSDNSDITLTIRVYKRELFTFNLNSDYIIQLASLYIYTYLKTYTYNVGTTVGLTHTPMYNYKNTDIYTHLYILLRTITKTQQIHTHTHTHKYTHTYIDKQINKLVFQFFFIQYFNLRLIVNLTTKVIIIISHCICNLHYTTSLQR